MFQKFASSVGKWLVDYGKHESTSQTQENRGRPPMRRLPPQPPASLYQQTAQNLTQLTPLQRQTLMLWLYQTNPVCKDLVRLVVDPVIGKGFSVDVPDDKPSIQKAINEYQLFNGFNGRKLQKNVIRSYINTGETLHLTAPFNNTWYTVRVSSTLIEQTVLDPFNPATIIAVILSNDMFGKVYVYKTVTDESRLSAPALFFRKFCPYYCFYDYNDEHDQIEYAASFPVLDIPFKSELPKEWNEWGQQQRRGEPFFTTWSDLFDHLVKTLWALLDKSKSWGAYNYHFVVQTDEDDYDDSARKVQTWQTAVGTPQMNEAIWTDERVEVKPMSFPMQSNDIQGIMDVMLQFSGQSSHTPMYDLGSTQHTPFATAKAQGNPKEQFMQSIQTDGEEIFLNQYNFVIDQEVKQGRIPRKEL
jgi:hypothetical protein